MSIKGKGFHLLLRHRHLLEGKLRAEVIDNRTNIEALRAKTEAAAARLVKEIEGVTHTPAEFPDFYAEWIRIDGASRNKVVLYFHGGGFVMGSARSHRNIIAGFASRLKVDVLSFDYRLAPEHPAPAAVCDGAKIYGWLLEQGYAPEDIVFAGDSAGAGIALATLLKIKDDGGILPAGCAVFSPCVDMTLSGASIRTKVKTDPCTPKGANETYTKYYVGSGDPRHPYASPLFGDLAGLPPIMIQVGEDETLLDDSVRFAEKAAKVGVEVKIKVWKGMFHCFPLLAPMFDEATRAQDETCLFIKEKLYGKMMQTKD